MTLSPTIFREYDIRGVVGRDLHPEAAEAIARAFGTYLASAGVRRAVIGHDNRASSPALYEAAVRGLASTGCDVITIGLAVTPMLYFAQRHFGVDGGVMVTASHNPPEFNGFKLAHGPGTLYGAQIQEIRRLAEGPAVRAGAGAVEGREILPAYAAMLRDRIRLGTRRLRVVADCGNGTASGMVPDILRAWEVDVIPLYCDSDPTFPHHHPDPVDPQNLRDLIREVAASRADVGLGFDGDGDRIGAVFAGEMSGHMFFADEYYGYDDAIYAAGRLLRILSRTERPLSALAGEIPRYHNTPEIRVACPDDRKHEVVARLVREFKARYEVIDIDGVRVVFPDGWGLVRASNTQPVLVVRAEGTTPEALDRIKAVLEAALRRYPEVAPVPW